MMNIFILDEVPKKAAVYHTDKHVVKQILETAQMLCTARYMLGDDSEIPYKPTHEHHVMTAWVRKSFGNFLWLSSLGFYLCKEYTHRYEKRHKCESIIRECLAWALFNPKSFSETRQTPFILYMPDELKQENAVEAYREYYRKCKSHLFNWKNREKPEWI